MVWRSPVPRNVAMLIGKGGGVDNDLRAPPGSPRRIFIETKIRLDTVFAGPLLLRLGLFRKARQVSKIFGRYKLTTSTSRYGSHDRNTANTEPLWTFGASNRLMNIDKILAVASILTGWACHCLRVVSWYIAFEVHNERQKKLAGHKDASLYQGTLCTDIVSRARRNKM